MWRMMRDHRAGDRGAVAIFVAIMVVAVLLPISAIVIDAGAIWAERRQQQNGADAGALAVAQTCVNGPCDASTSATSTAGSLANSNSNDNKSQVDLVCGTATGLPPCPAPTGQRWDCPAATGSVPYVQVYTSVLTSDNKHVLPAWFGRIVLGSSFGGAAVKACARAAMGPASSLISTLPLTISLCEWDSYTADGTKFAPPPSYGNPPTYPTSYDHVIYFHDTTGASPCPDGPAGADLPGGFGWLQTSTGCNTPSTSGGWYNDSTGRPPPNSCTWQLMQQMQGQVVNIPIFNNTNNLTGSNGQYHIAGYAAFFLAGYSIEGQYKAQDLATGAFPCNGSQSCISGWFTTSLTSGGTPSGGGTNYGTQVVGLTG
jgi:hypothetical protein